MGDHINAEGEFQSDKYPTCPAGKVPLSTKDPMAQDLLWQYAQRRRAVDAEFADDLEAALRSKGYEPRKHDGRNIAEAAPHAAYCDLALQDAQYEADGEQIWLYDDAKFDASLAGHGYAVVRIGPGGGDLAPGLPGTPNAWRMPESDADLRDIILMERAKEREAWQRQATRPREVPDTKPAVIEECAMAAHKAASQFLSRDGNYVLMGPAGMASTMVAAIRALKKDAGLTGKEG